MKILIRVAFLFLSLTVGIPAVANAANAQGAATPAQQDITAGWVNG